jgi:LacI family transcriptional regulator
MLVNLDSCSAPVILFIYAKIIISSDFLDKPKIGSYIPLKALSKVFFMPKLTLDEIGKLAGVSRATVSRVVNGYPHIRPEIRERVQNVISENQFYPNPVARSLVTQSTNIIGLFVPSVIQFIFADPYLTALIPEISKACNAHDYTPALFLFHSEEDEQKQFNRILHSSMVDGLIMTADRRDTSFIPQLIGKGVPFVLMGRPSKFADQITFIDSDNRGGAYSAVKHLIEQGKRRIGLITTVTNTAAEDRTEGYWRALIEADFPLEPGLVAEGDFTEESGYRAMQQLVPCNLDAVFVVSDTMAIGALRALREASIHVPDDIAVASFDDLPTAATAHPPLTTVRQPIGNGSLAVKTLLDIIQSGDRTPRHITVPTQLIVRASSGAVQSDPSGNS